MQQGHARLFEAGRGGVGLSKQRFDACGLVVELGTDASGHLFDFDGEGFEVALEAFALLDAFELFAGGDLGAAALFAVAQADHHARGHQEDAHDQQGDDPRRLVRKFRGLGERGRVGRARGDHAASPASAC